MNNGKISVLFMQSQPYFHADSQVHEKLMRYLDRNNFEIHVACNPGSKQVVSDALTALNQVPNIQVRPTTFGPSIHSDDGLKLNADLFFDSGRLMKTSADLVRYAKAHKIDIVHCSEKPRDAFYGYWLAQSTRAKCLIHLHIKVEDWISPLSKWAMHRVDALVGVSEFVAQSSISMGFPSERTHHVLNGLDLERWTEETSDGRIRAEFNLAPETTLLVAVARLATYKGQAELLRALQKVKAVGYDFHLLLVGSEDPVMGNKAELEALTQSLHLSEQVTFTGFRKDAKKIFAACDIFALPSFEEPFGMVFVEAMAMQKPVVALASGGVAEIVEHERAGLLSEPQDIDQLADNIIRLIGDKPLCRQMGEYGRSRVYEYFNAQRMTADFEKLYKNLLDKPQLTPVANHATALDPER